ncbi:MAG: hypothetical protein AUG06_06630 [Actinobacteria bacterium 13_1_20CM_2_65_11]|nr:MAG: hypothetical protein AUG06_06630 [Actinobacteria bacterium 13_1_20CM_2_65_11]
MRADRVLAMLLLLQARGRVTASELANRLEVSRRTVYRDMVALSAAGVPVHADPGPNGGIELMAGWRTDLTGLTASEVEALFTSAAGPQFESAMGKLAAALPGETGRRAGRIRERLLVDSAGWGRRSAVSPHLRVVQDAVFGDRRLHLTYRRAESQIVERDVDPLGLIIKAGVWYLLADVDSDRRLFRLSRIEAARALDEPARRPKRFDLARAWREQSAHWESGRAGYQVLLKVAYDDDLALVLRVAGGPSRRAAAWGSGAPCVPRARAGGRLRQLVRGQSRGGAAGRGPF